MPSYLDLAHGRRLATTGCSLSLKTHLFGKQGLHSGAFRFRVSGPPAAGAGPSQRAADSARRQLLDWHWQPGQWQRAPALPAVVCSFLSLSGVSMDRPVRVWSGTCSEPAAVSHGGTATSESLPCQWHYVVIPLPGA